MDRISYESIPSEKSNKSHIIRWRLFPWIKRSMLHKIRGTRPFSKVIFSIYSKGEWTSLISWMLNKNSNSIINYRSGKKLYSAKNITIIITINSIQILINTSKIFNHISITILKRAKILLRRKPKWQRLKEQKGIKPLKVKTFKSQSPIIRAVLH